MLFAGGLVYATSTMIGEHYYATGMRPIGYTIAEAISFSRAAGKFNPFDPLDRGASARQLSIIALQQEDKGWLNAARSEVIYALKTDYSAADLLLKLVAIDLKLGDDKEAQTVFEQFKRVNPSSPIIKLVEEQNRQKQAAPSP